MRETHRNVHVDQVNTQIKIQRLKLQRQLFCSLILCFIWGNCFTCCVGFCTAVQQSGTHPFLSEPPSLPSPYSSRSSQSTSLGSLNSNFHQRSYPQVWFTRFLRLSQSSFPHCSPLRVCPHLFPEEVHLDTFRFHVGTCLNMIFVFSFLTYVTLGGYNSLIHSTRTDSNQFF